MLGFPRIPRCSIRATQLERPRGSSRNRRAATSTCLSSTVATMQRSEIEDVRSEQRKAVGDGGFPRSPRCFIRATQAS